MKTLLLLLAITSCFFAETQEIFSHSINFSSGTQSMWGPGGSPFNLNKKNKLVDVDWSNSMNEGSIQNIKGAKFGGSLNGATSGAIDFTLSSTGFSLGTIEVDYPVDINIQAPANLSYSQGTFVNLNTDYNVKDTGYSFKTVYPTVGEVALDFSLDLSASLNAKVCAFGCSNVPNIPNINTNGPLNFNLFRLNTNGLSIANDIFSPANGSFSPIYYPLNLSLIPVFNEWGIQGTLQMPNVKTDYWLDTTTNILRASGDSVYVEGLGLNVFPFVAKVLEEKKQIKYALMFDALGQDFPNLPRALEIEYVILQNTFTNDISNKQEFEFNPDILGKYELETPVNWIIEKNNSIIDSGYSTEINFNVGEVVKVQFPCNYETLKIVPKYSIKGRVRNKTYDNVQFKFNVEALSAKIKVPGFTIVPEFSVKFCWKEIYWKKWKGPRTRTACKRISTPAVKSPNINVSLGPVYEKEINVGNPIKNTWIDKTWDLEGFGDYVSFDTIVLISKPFSVAETHTDVTCFGGNDGSIEVQTINGTAPFTYEWTNGSVAPNLTNATEGNYNVTVTDANGCQAYTGTHLSQPTTPISIISSVTDDSCFGAPGDGSISLNVEGGTPFSNGESYLYAWSNGETTKNINNLISNNYTVTVTDASGCTQTETITVGEPYLLKDSLITVTNAKCYNGSDGKVELLMAGGTLPYSYSWSNGSSNQNLLNVSAGNYTLTTTDGNGCVFSSNYTVSEPVAPLALSTSSVSIDCFGNTNGSATVNVTGGTSPYTYEWTDSLNQVINQNTITVIDLPAGLYTVTVQDTNNCTASTSETIAQPLSPLSATANLTAVDCKGNATGSIDLVVSGGTSGYTFNWSNGANSEDLTNLTAGDYTVTITDANNCVENYTFTITEPANELLTNFTKTDVLCFGENTGEITSTTSGGTAPYSFLWNTGETTPNINAVLAGNYTLTVTDNNNCVTSINPIINQPLQALTLSETHVNVSCFNGNDGSIDLTVVGGTAPYQFEWSNGANITLIDLNEDLVNLTNDTYTVVVTDANNCTETLSIAVTQPSAPLSFTNIIDDVNCKGDSDGSINITTLGGTPNYTFNWSNGNTTEDLVNITAGDYTLTVTDFLNCTYSENFTVNEPNAILSAVVTTEAVRCFGEAKGAVDLTVNGGTAPYYYLWNNNATTEDILDVISGTYTVTITDDQGCTTTAGGFVSQPANPLSVAVDITDPSCYSFNNGEIKITATGATAPYSFSWGNQNQYLMNNASETLNNVSSGDYMLRVEDKYECSFEDIVTINEPDTIEVTEIITPVSCFDGTDGEIDITAIGGTAPYQFNWSNATTSEDNFNLTSNNYELTLIDAQNCIYEASYFVAQPNALRVIETVTKVSCIDQVDGTISVETTGGTPPYSWLWTTGDYTDFIENLAPGMYGLEVLDNNNCSQTYDFIVPENALECLTIPNTFTPNGDNYNDVWNIKNLYLYPDATVQIYNRWGNLLYEANGDYTPWNGRINGEDLSAGVYYYVIVLENDVNNKYTGTITIIR